MTEFVNTQELGLTKFLKSTVNDDVLLEIFLRLPDYLSVLNCSYVCSRWRRVIGHPEFSNLFKRRLLCPFATPVPFTLLLRRRGYPSHRRWQRNSANHINSVTLFSSKALLHRLRHDESNYLDFLPEWQYCTVKASCNDLLLVELSPQCLCVCNPMTRRWFLLPEPRPLPGIFGEYSYALACDPRLGGGFRVALFKKTRVTVFSSDSGEWGQYQLAHPPAPEETLFHMEGKVAAGDGVVYSPLAAFSPNGFIMKNLVAFDPSGQTRAVGLPGGFKSGWRAAFKRARIWIVRGRLRLWQAYWDKVRVGGAFVFKLWELRLHEDEWDPIHDLVVATAGDAFTLQSLVLALHPDDDCTFYFKDDRPILWQYNVRSGISQIINCEIGSSDQDISYDAFPLVHPRWPTDVSA